MSVRLNKSEDPTISKVKTIKCQNNRQALPMEFNTVKKESKPLLFC